MDFKKLTTREKALRINLDPALYGSFAEIGAGQEVASNFFKAGGASGTVAKTMSAYDMAFSDAIYGPEESGRYVCESRLKKMLHKEYRLLGERLQGRAERTCFFAFANTVEQINFNRTNEGHGWIGIRFQLTPQHEPNECVIHVKLRDNDPLQQQQVLGVLGVNLIYAAFYLHEDLEQFMLSLVDDVGTHRVAINYFSIAGPDFLEVDNRLLSLKLVKNGLAKATMFGPDGKVMMPADALYKKNILVTRGRFRPVTLVNVDMFERAYQSFCKEVDGECRQVVRLAELTLSNLRITEDKQKDEKDFLDRADLLCALGYSVLVSNFQEYYRLSSYLSRFTRDRKVGMVVGLYNLEYIFTEQYYSQLKGGILEAFGELFKRNTKLYVYPSLRKETLDGPVMHIHDIKLEPHLQKLLEYLCETGKIEDLQVSDKDHLRIVSDNVMSMIVRGEDGWEQMVPEVVVDAIKANCLFDYPCSLEHKKRIEDMRQEVNRERQRNVEGHSFV